MAEWEKYLSPHGQRKETCEYVVGRFDLTPEYRNNATIRRWVECSKMRLAEIAKEEYMQAYWQAYRDAQILHQGC